MFSQRAAVTLTLGPFALFLIYLGGWAFFIAIVAFLSVAAVEYSSLMAHMERRVSRLLLLISCWVIYLAAWFSPAGDLRVVNAALAVAFLAALIHALWRYETGRSLQAASDWLAASGGVILLGWLGSHFILMRQLDPVRGGLGWEWTMLVVLAAWSADSFAYLVGKYVAGTIIMNRHLLSPHLSPKKSVEGYIGGVILASALTVAVGVLWFGHGVMTMLILALLVTIIGTVGDLSISLLKRAAGVKDSGNIFPGHGGALDRLDSLLWTITIAYYVVSLIASINFTG